MPVNSECLHTAPRTPCSPTEEPKPFLFITKTITVRLPLKALLPPGFLSSSACDLTGYQLDGSTSPAAFFNSVSISHSKGEQKSWSRRCESSANSQLLSLRLDYLRGASRIWIISSRNLSCHVAEAKINYNRNPLLEHFWFLYFNFLTSPCGFRACETLLVCCEKRALVWRCRRVLPSRQADSKLREEEKRALRYLETRRDCNSVQAVSVAQENSDSHFHICLFLVCFF